MSDAFLLDIRKLTQEQFDRAMNGRGTCTYSGPCILGAMMPDALIEEILECGCNGSSVSTLVSRGLIAFNNEAQADLARMVQSAFDDTGVSSERRWHAVRRLRELLPHLDHGKYL